MSSCISKLFAIVSGLCVRVGSLRVIGEVFSFFFHLLTLICCMCVGAARICHHVPLSHLGFAGACLCRPLAEDLSICLILPDLFAMTKVRARIATQGQGVSLGKPIPNAVPAANVIGLAAARARLATQGLGESLGEPIPKAAPADARRVVLVPRAALMNAPESVPARAHDGVHGLDGCSDDDSSSESVSKAWRRRGRERLGPRQLSNSPPPETTSRHPGSSWTTAVGCHTSPLLGSGESSERQLWCTTQPTIFVTR